MHYLNRGEALLETDKNFRKRFVKCREEYIGEDPVYYYSAPELRTKYLEMRDDYENLVDKYHTAIQQAQERQAFGTAHRYGPYAHQEGH